MFTKFARFGIAAAGLLILIGSLVRVDTPAKAASLHHAGLVLRHSNGAIITRTVAFGEDAITGLDLLQRSGLGVIIDTTSGLGAAIAQIDGEGCNYPKESAFCKCQGRPCIYWNYYHQRGGAWVYSSLGASGSLIKDGDVDAWGWGDGSIGAQIPVIPFSSFYSPPQPTPTPIPPTATRMPPTPTPRPPTATRVPPTATLAPQDARSTSTVASARNTPPTNTVTPARDTPPTVSTATPIVGGASNPDVSPTISASACCADTQPTRTVMSGCCTNTPPATTAPIVALAPTDAPPSSTPTLPQPAPTATTAAPPANDPPIFGYAVFGIVALGLGGLWLWNSRKR